MARSRQILTNFRAGVLSPNIMGLVDSAFYASGLQIGKNVVIETMGGLKRRSGTQFIREYGVVPYMRIFPFTFNRDQAYIIVVRLQDDAGILTGFIDIYRDNVPVAQNIATPYNTEQKVKELDFAQSADSMIFTQGDHAPQLLRRLGSDDNWDFIPTPIVSPPEYNCSGEPEVCEPMWTDELGHPQYCTFHQGRLWFAATRTFPQHVWSSKVQDFFNFDLSDGSAADSIQEALDTDFINPITSIYSARQLQVFTRGAEFTNEGGVLTPTTSHWVRQSDYGSEYFVPPLTVDGATLFVDSTGRTIRNFTYADERGGYDAPSLSAAAEHLVKIPQRMGVLRGSALEPANFVYVINLDGTMAVLNLSKAHDILAWTEWTTQGFYRDVVTIDRDVYILVQRLVKGDGEFVTYEGDQVFDNGEPVYYGENPDAVANSWMLEKLSDLMYVDSGSLSHNLQESNAFKYLNNELNFFGVYYAPDGTGKTVIVKEGVIVFQTDYLRGDPTRSYLDLNDLRYSAANIFSYNEDVRAQYFDEEVSYQWYMYALTSIQVVDTGKNYIDGLTHLIGSEVVSTLDGNIQDPQVVKSGADEITVEKSYPDGTVWEYETGVNEIIRHTVDGNTTQVDAWYNGAYHTNLALTEFGYLISGVAGEDGSEYLEQGIVRTSSQVDNPQTFDVSGTFNVPFGVTEVEFCGCAGGGSGSSTESNSPGLTMGGGRRGELFKGLVAVDSGVAMPLTIGIGGAQSWQNTDGKAGSNTILGDKVLTGGAGGIYRGAYAGVGGSFVTPCGATYHDGTQTHSGIAYAQGGEAGLFGNGGRGGVHDNNGVNGGVGAGGGSILYSEHSGQRSGAGGNGRVVITMAGTAVTYRHEVRKMVLIEVTVTEGVVTFDEQYYIGQAGLYFPVVAKTMPLNVNAGAGSLVNEPKRIVSITSRYKDTQGVVVNGIEVPERFFGEDALDKAPPLLTGTEKNRHLGYNRETSVTITQNDPMPFTLLSIDVEINY